MADVVIDGRSGTAAAWLAARARETGRRVPEDVVVSADLVAGPDGVPRLASVDGAAAKARVVSREMPGARILFCGDAEGSSVEELPAGEPVMFLERLVWGNTAITDRTELMQTAGAARDAFSSHDYAAAAGRYQALVERVRPQDTDLQFEACLRLAAIAVHQGRTAEAQAWYARADDVRIPESKKGSYKVERLAGLAGSAIDSFRADDARRLLQEKLARRALEEDHCDLWERIQVWGAWRRLHLLEGTPDKAREVQQILLDAADEAERPRALLDLGFVELRCGALQPAAEALRAARHAIEGLPRIYRVQSQAFLSWHVGRLARLGGEISGLEDLVDRTVVDALLGVPTLQEAGRWRLEVVRGARGGDLESLATLASRLRPFQAWYCGVYLLDAAESRELGFAVLQGAEVDLGGLPELAEARERLRRGEAVPAEVFRGRAAY